MNVHKSIDWLIDAYRDHESSTASPVDCAGLIAKLKDPAHVQALIDEAEIQFHDPLIPRQFGDYDILGTAGAGGMGEVFRVRHNKLNRIQALKLLPPHRLENQQANRRFEREMQAIGQLKHPNIVTVYDAGVVDGTPFMSMELIDGQSLAQMVREHKKSDQTISIKLAVEIITQAAKGVQHAHENGVLHRDIKPANLMVDENGTVKLLDLGLAKVSKTGTQKDSRGMPSLESRQLTADQQILGTPDFMAPEQISGNVDERTDIYALGATLYYLLTGQVLFPEVGNSLIHRALAVTSRQAPSANVLRPDIPESLNEIIANSLSKDPAHRQQSASQFIAEIQAAAKTLPHTLTETTAEKDAQTVAKTIAKTVGEAQGDPRHPFPSREPDSSESEVAAHEPLKHPAAQTSRGWPPIGWLKVAVAGLVPLGLILLSIFLFKGPDGSTLKVVCDDPNVIVQAEWVGGDDASPADTTVELGEQTEQGKTTKLQLGPWKLSIKGDNATKYSLSSDRVELKRGEQTVVSVTHTGGLVGKNAANTKSQLIGNSESNKHEPAPANRPTDRPRPTDGELLARLDGIDWQPGEPNKLMGDGYASTPTKLDSIPGEWQIIPTFSHAVGRYASISPKGTYLAVGQDAEYGSCTRIFKRETGELMGVFSTGGIFFQRILWSPDESQFLHLKNGGHWNAIDATLCRLDGTMLAKWHSDVAMRSIEWSPDGKRILIVGPKKIEQRAPDGQVVESFKAPGHGSSSPFHKWSRLWSPDGTKFAVVHDGKVFIYPADGGKPTTILKQEGLDLHKVAWHPSGEKLLTNGQAKDRTFVDRLWNLSGEFIEFQHKRWVESFVAFSPDGRYAMTQYGDIRDMTNRVVSQLDLSKLGYLQNQRALWPEQDRIIFWAHDQVGTGYSIDFSPTGRVLAEFDHVTPLPQHAASWHKDSSAFRTNAGLFSGATATQLLDWSVSGQDAADAIAQQTNTRPHVAYSPNMQRYAAETTTGTTAVFNIQGDKLYEVGKIYSPQVRSWSPDGKLLAIASSHGEATPVEVYRGEQLVARFEGHKTGVAGVAWHPENRLLAVWDEANNARIWDIDAPEKPIFEKQGVGFSGSLFASGEWKWHWSLPVWSPDGSRLAIPTKETVALVSPTGEPEIEIPWSKEQHGAIWWSQDGQSIVLRNTVYDLKGNQADQIDGDPVPAPMLFWLDQNRLATAWKNGVAIWDKRDRPATVIRLPSFGAMWYGSPQFSVLSRGLNAQRISSDGRYLIHTSLVMHAAGLAAGDIHLIDLQQKKHLWTGVAYSDGKRVRIAATGKVLSAPKDFDRYLIYLIQYPCGHTVGLTRIQFAARIGLSKGQQFVQKVLDLGGTVGVAGSETLISKADIADARDLPTLNQIIEIRLGENFFQTVLSQDFLAGIEQLTNLKTLDVSGTSLTSHGLKFVPEISSLNSLNVSGLKIGNGFATLLTNKITDLNVSNTDVGDFFVSDLKRFKLLKKLNLTGTQASVDEVERLKAILPDCEVIWRQPD